MCRRYFAVLILKENRRTDSTQSLFHIFGIFQIEIIEKSRTENSMGLAR